MKKCIVCRSSVQKKYYGGGRDYILKECKNCAFIFDDRNPENSEKIYTKNYYTNSTIKGGYLNYFEESIVNKLTFKYRLNKIFGKIKTKNVKLLDFGCALGDFLEVAKSLSWTKIVGVELSKFAVKECRKKGLLVYKAGKEAQKSLKNNYFDIVTLQDVIEHIENPNNIVKNVFELLKPGGYLYLTTPDISSLSARVLNKYWYHYKKNEHLNYFNSDNIQIILIKAGFRDIIVDPAPSWVTVKYILDRLSFYFPHRIKRIFKNLNNPIFNIAFPIYAGEIEVCAIKPLNE